MSREPEIKLCTQCSVSFKRDVRYSRIYWAKQKFCSRKCFGLWLSFYKDSIRPDKREKFNSQIKKSDGCWEWTGLKDKDGYGLFPYNSIQNRAPKIALELDGRPVPKGMYACHTCDNPICVRPDHLYPGTPKQNMADAKARGRLRPGKCAKLTELDVRTIRSLDWTNNEIAKLFKISPANVSLIQLRRTWANVK